MNDLVPIGRKKGRPRLPGSTPASRVAILLEDIQAQVRLTMEAVTGFRAEFRSEIDKLRHQNTEGILRIGELLERKADHEALLKLETRVQVVERRLGIQ